MSQPLYEGGMLFEMILMGIECYVTFNLKLSLINQMYLI